MSQKKVFETDGIAGDLNQVGGVLNTETYVAPANRNVQRSKAAKDVNVQTKQLENDELAPAWPLTRDARNSTPESA